MAETARIDRLTLRLPGLSREDGQRVGRAVAEQLAAMAAEAEPQHLGALTLRVHAERGASADSLARAISDALRKELAP